MLKVSKHTNPIYSIINITSLIISELNDKDIVGYNDLLVSLIRLTSKSVKEVIPYSLSFLFITNRIEYIKDIDALRLKK